MLGMAVIKEQKVLNLKDFVYLLFGTLATNSRLTDLEDRSKKIMFLPAQYKQIIANILCAENGWKERFSSLIDIEEYFDNHFVWEINLSYVIKEVLMELKKTFEYDLVFDRLLLSFTYEEINAIMSRYADDEIKNRMDHFSNLLVDYIYTREFQENFHDYYASTVKKFQNKREQDVNIECQSYTSACNIKSKIKNIRVSKRKVN